MPKEIYGKWLFVNKDKDWKDCCIGDLVRISRAAFSFECDACRYGGCHEWEKHTDGQVQVAAYECEGILKLVRSIGIVLECMNERGKRYYMRKLKYGNKSQYGNPPFVWELLATDRS